MIKYCKEGIKRTRPWREVDLQYDDLKQKILGRSMQDGWTEERRRGNAGERDVLKVELKR